MHLYRSSRAGGSPCHRPPLQLAPPLKTFLQKNQGLFLLLISKFLRRMGELLFDDIFRVERVNPDGKKFDKVTRIEARSEKCGMFMQLDVNTEIYPIDREERFLVALSTTLSLEGGQSSLADKFEYIMHGKLYKVSDEPQPKTSDGASGPGVKVEIYVSFGGLQMMLRGDPSHCAKFELDQRLFLLMRKMT